MTCQRCLEAVTVRIDAEFRLGLVEAEQSMVGLPDGLDPLLVRRYDTCSLARLIEDELILALPIVPKHDETEACAGKKFIADGATRTRRAFSGLGALWARAKDQE